MKKKQNIDKADLDVNSKVAPSHTPAKSNSYIQSQLKQRSSNKTNKANNQQKLSLLESSILRLSITLFGQILKKSLLKCSPPLEEII